MRFLPNKAQSAKGGSVTAAASAAKAAALRRLHRRRRGQPINKPGALTDQQYRGLLADILTRLRHIERGRISRRALAAHCAVHERTVRRWLDGTDQAGAQSVQRLRSWLRQFQ